MGRKTRSFRRTGRGAAPGARFSSLPLSGYHIRRVYSSKKRRAERLAYLCGGWKRTVEERIQKTPFPEIEPLAPEGMMG